MSDVIVTVEDLRAALDGLPGERQIMFQVVALDGSAWNMRAEFASVPIGYPDFLAPTAEKPLVDGATLAVLTLSHPGLLRLPSSAWEP